VIGERNTMSESDVGDSEMRGAFVIERARARPPSRRRSIEGSLALVE